MDRLLVPQFLYKASDLDSNVESYVMCARNAEELGGMTGCLCHNFYIKHLILIPKGSASSGGSRICKRGVVVQSCTRSASEI